MSSQFPEGQVLGAFWLEARRRYGNSHVEFEASPGGGVPERVTIRPGRGFEDVFELSVQDEQHLRVLTRMPPLLRLGQGELFWLGQESEIDRLWQLIGPRAGRGATPARFKDAFYTDLYRYYGKDKVFTGSAQTPKGALWDARFGVYSREHKMLGNKGAAIVEALSPGRVRVIRFGPFEEVWLGLRDADLFARVKSFIGPGFRRPPTRRKG